MQINRTNLAFGVLAGALAGILLARREGAETRARAAEIGRELAEIAAAPLQEVAASFAARRARRKPPPVPCEPTL